MQKITENTWLEDSVILLLFSSVFYFIFLGSHALFTPDEGRYAEIAREMLATQNYLTPMLNGVPFLDKPIFHYWLSAFAMSIFGVNEWAARFFPALCGVIGILITSLTGRLLFDRMTGLLAGLILATSPLYFAAAHYDNLDLEVAVFISASLLLFLSGTQQTGKLRTVLLLSAYFFASLAFLTKGLIGIIFPAVIVGAWVTLLRQWSLLKSVRLFTGFCMIAAINIPWYVLAARENPAFLHYFFITQQFTRFTSGGAFNNVLPFWFYLPVILVGLFLWSFFLPQSLYFKIKEVTKRPNAHPVELFLLLMIGIIFLFFSIPHSKIITYILPIFPALALLIASYLSVNIKKHQTLIFIFLMISTILLSSVTALSKFYVDNSEKRLTEVLRATKKPQDDVMHFYRYFYDVPFYLGETVSIVADWDPEKIAEKDNWQREMSFAPFVPESKNWLINDDEFLKRWQGKNRVFIFVEDNYLNNFQLLVKNYTVVSYKGSLHLLSNH